MAISIGQPVDDSIRANSRCRRGDFVISQRIGKANICCDVSGKEKDVLLNVGNQSPKRIERHFTNVAPVHENPAALRIVESHQETDYSRFSGAGMADEREGLPWLRRKRHALENPLRRC